MDADDYDWEWQKLKLQAELASVDGDAFETLFQRIAKRRWGTTFTPTIPMGRRGDLKCDGFESGSGSVFQCYGPRYGQADVGDALKKVQEDFTGAHAHWGKTMEKWVFMVSLYRDKVPSEIVLLVEQLAKRLGVPAEIWTRDELVDLTRELAPADRIELFGRPPNRADMVRRVTYANIGRALAFVRGGASSSPLESIGLPPAVGEKVEFNLLPPSVQRFLSIGQLASDRVRQYLTSNVDPQEADSMAAGFSRRYSDAKREGGEPVQIFQQLLIYAGGATGDPEREAAALAIVCHFFSTCEIFERPPSEQAA